MSQETGRAAPKRQARTRKEYEETPDWGSSFQRVENKPPQPQFTGQGVLSEDTINEILESGGEFQIAIWSLGNDGQPMRNRDGSRRFRLHIEAPYKGADDSNGNGEQQQQQQRDEPEDIPF